MALKNDILNELKSADDYISGEYLAGKFGKSRAAIWKAVSELRQSGIEIDSASNKGYKIGKISDALNADTISAALKSKIPVLYFDSIDSTNNEAKRRLDSIKSSPLLIVASQQTAGRGRQGKSFFSPKGSGVYFSLVLHPKSSLQNAVTATTAAAVAVCKAIEEFTDLKPQIKWVNDVFSDGKKICGILTEAVSDFESGIVDSVIIGIGINLTTKAFPKEIKDAGALNRNINVPLFVAKTADELAIMSTQSYNTFIDYYREHSMIIGKKIIYFKNGEKFFATAQGIDDTGGLIIENADGTKEVLRSGNVTIRKA